MKTLLTTLLLIIFLGSSVGTQAQCNFPTNDVAWNLYPDGIQNAPEGTSEMTIAGPGNNDYNIASNKGSYFMLNFSSATVGKTFTIGNDATSNGTDDGIPLGTAITIYAQDGTYIADAINTTAGGTHVTFTVPQAGNYWVLFNTASCGANGSKSNVIKVKCTTCNNTPANDEPYAAVPLTVAAPNTSPTMVAGTTVYATSTYMNPWGYTGPVCASSSCSGGVTAYPNDVWYKVYSSNYTKLNISINAPSQIGTVGLIRVYSSPNGYNNFSLHSCGCSVNSMTPLSSYTVNNVQPNTVYFIAVSPKVGTSGFWTPFSIGVKGDYTSMIVQTDGLNVNNNTNIIQWSSQEDADVIGYEVESSNLQAEGFATIGEVGANGTLSTVNYDYADEDAQQDVTYYRIKMIYSDDTYSYSSVVKINKALTENDIAIYPNPAIDHINISSNLVVEGGGTIHIYDMNGRILKSETYNDLQRVAPINISSLSDGMYLVEVNMENGQSRKLKLNKTQSGY
jgi:hypothetical protein